MKLADPEIVRNEYATEAGLRARWSAYEQLTGLTAPEIAFRAVEEIMPARMLEVGCGWGDFSARVAAELGVEVTAIDISPRMVELARERGVDARVADVQELPFPGRRLRVRRGQLDALPRARSRPRPGRARARAHAGWTPGGGDERAEAPG